MHLKQILGIVALNFETQMPLVFKTDIQQAHGMKQSFTPGFGCTIETALMCSTAAYPFFEKMNIKTEHHGEIEVVDGGFIANNSTLYSMIDAYKALKYKESDVNLLNVGVGNYRKSSIGLKHKFLKMFHGYNFVEKIGNYTFDSAK